MMPFLAILQHDLAALWHSRLVRLWLAATAVLTLLVTATNWAELPSAELIASLLFPYLVFPWFLVVIVLGVNPVTGSRTEALSDGILSRPVTRWEYLLAAWSARVALVLGSYLAVTLPAIVLVVTAKRPPQDDAVTVYGIVSALGVVALVLTLLVSMGFLVGTLVRKPLLAVVVLVFVWYPINIVLSIFSLEEFSPISLNQAIPTLARQPWRQVEPGPEETAEAEPSEPPAPAATRFLSVFAEAEPAPEPEPEPGFFQRKQFGDFSLGRVILGYGLPTVLSVALATLCFCWRDL